MEGIDLRPFCGPVLPQLMGAAGTLRQMNTGLGGLLQPVGALHANIVIFRLADLMVQPPGKRQHRGILDRMGQLRGRFGLVFLKLQLARSFSSFRIGGFALFLFFSARFLLGHAPFHLFAVLGRRCIFPHRRPVRLTLFRPVMLLQTAPVLLGIGEMETGLSLSRHSRSPASHRCSRYGRWRSRTPPSPW